MPLVALRDIRVMDGDSPAMVSGAIGTGLFPQGPVASDIIQDIFIFHAITPSQNNIIPPLHPLRLPYDLFHIFGITLFCTHVASLRDSWGLLGGFRRRWS